MTNPRRSKSRHPSKSFIFTIAVCGLLPAAIMLGQGTTQISEGVQLLRAGHVSEAKAKFDLAVKAAPRSADALTWRGLCENQLQQYSAAAADFQAAIRFDDTALPAHYNLALSLIRLHKDEAAIEQLKIVIQAQPNAVSALYNLAVLLESAGSLQQAVERLRTAHTLAPEDKGVALHLLKDTLKLSPAGDLTVLLSELADSSTTPEMELEAGAALIEAGRFSDALPLLKAARERDPTAPEIDLLLARGLIGSGQDKQAIALLESAPSTGSRNKERFYLLGLAYARTGSLQIATQTLQAAADLDRKDARPLYQLGLIAASDPSQQSEAARLLRTAFQLDPANAVYRLALARLLLVIDQPRDAYDVLAKSPMSNGDEAQRLALIGVSLAAMHETDQSISKLSSAVQKDPNLAFAQNVLGFCYLQQGKYAEAAAAYGKASELQPRKALYARDAAIAFERANASEQAIRFAERANDIDKTSASGHALLGKLYASAGHDQEAVGELLRAAELNPDLDSAVYLLARTYQKMGDRQQAIVWSERLSAIKQKHEAAFVMQKKEAAQIRSSILLEGGSTGADQAGVP